EAEILVALAGRDEGAVRRPAVAGGEAPATAPLHAVRARGRACRIHCSATSIFLIPVLHPLPDIAMHVIESPGVGLQLPHWVRLQLSCFALIPRIASELAGIIPKAPAGRSSSARRVLPLRLSGQAIHRPTFSTIKPANELL